MTTTYPNAIDEMFAAFRTVWNAGSAAIAGYVPEVRWPGVEKDDKPPTEKYWVRVSQQTVAENQATVNADTVNGKRRFTGLGLIFIQIFAPMSKSDGYDKGRQLSVLAKSAFRGQDTPGGVIFRNARINELAPDGKAYRFNVVSEYEYDEIA